LVYWIPACAGLTDSRQAAGYQSLKENTAAEFQKELSIIQEIFAEEFGDTEHKMPMGNGVNYLLAEPFLTVLTSP